MKTWQRPAAVGQEFAANEYVSACVIVHCDFTDANKAVSALHGWGLAVPNDLPDFEDDDHAYFACNHEFDIKVDELKPCKFTHTLSGPEEISLGDSYPAYYWVKKVDGVVLDFHATSVSPDQLAAGNAS